MLSKAGADMDDDIGAVKANMDIVTVTWRHIVSGLVRGRLDTMLRYHPFLSSSPIFGILGVFWVVPCYLFIVVSQRIGTASGYGLQIQPLVYHQMMLRIHLERQSMKEFEEGQY
jgi:hypothetical protein